MKCIICKIGETAPKTATVILNREETAVILKQVPADVCENCGEYYLSDDVAGEVLRKAEEAVSRGVEVEICHYAA